MIRLLASVAPVRLSRAALVVVLLSIARSPGADSALPDATGLDGQWPTVVGDPGGLRRSPPFAPPT